MIFTSIGGVVNNKQNILRCARHDPVDARSIAWVFGRFLDGTQGFESRRGKGRCLSPGSVVCCQVEESATGRLPVQRTPTECDVSECDLETSMMRRPRPTTVVESVEGGGVTEQVKCYIHGLRGKKMLQYDYK